MKRPSRTRNPESRLASDSSAAYRLLPHRVSARLGVPVEFVTYSAAGSVVDAAATNEWDAAYVAIDHRRGTDIFQTPPYVVIVGAYLVANDSPIRSNDEVDRQGIRVAVGKGSAYDLFLTRELKRASIMRAPSSPATVETMIQRGFYRLEQGLK